MRQYKQIVCDICGDVAEVPLNRKFNYCDKEQCVKEARDRIHLTNSRKYYLKKKQEMEAMKEAKNEEPQQVEKPTYSQIENVVISNGKKVNTTAITNTDFSDIREIARRLGTIRYELIQLIEKEREEIRKLDKEDITLLHSFELDNLTKEEVYELYLKTKDRRTDRRGGKYRYSIINAILSAIDIKNPDKFIAMAISQGKTSPNFEEVIESLKKDETLFCYKSTVAVESE